MNICLICKKLHYVKSSHLLKGWGKYCSITCRTKSQFGGKKLECTICQKSLYRSNNELKRSKSGRYFCSKSCQTIWRNKEYSTEKHPAWKTNITTYRKRLIDSQSYSICRLCGIEDPAILNAHHLDHNRLNNQLNNLT